MSKLILRIFVAISCLLAFSSCNNIDKEAEYSFRYTLEYRLSKEADVKPLTDFFKERIDFESVKTYFGTQSETIIKASNDFIKMCELKLTNEEVEALLPSDNDAVALNLMMIIGSGYSPVAQIIWNHKSETDGDSE